MIMLKILFRIIFVVFLFVFSRLYCQPYLEWAKIYSGGSFSLNDGYAIITDANLNVYITGQSRKYNDDFSYVTIKYNANGDSNWVRRYNKCYSELGCDNGGFTVDLDNSGNVYVGGTRSLIIYSSNGDTAWVRDSIRIVKLIVYNNQFLYIAGISRSGGMNSYITYKYDLNGNMIWYRLYKVGSTNEPNDIVTDMQGNIIVTGRSNTLPPNINYDYITIKYNPNGDSLWTRRYDGGAPMGFDFGYGVAVDSFDNVYVTGRSDINSVSRYVTIKYDPVGNVIWSAQHNNNGSYATDIAIDRSGNVIVTGNTCSAGCYTTVKYTSSGIFIWAKSYQQTTSFVSIINSVLLDNNDNIYVNVAGAVPPDTSGLRVIKYDSSGNTIWTAYHFGGSGEVAHAITLDRNNNLYATGIMNQQLITAKFSQTLTNIEPISSQIPKQFQVEQNYPNPFNPSTFIRFQVPNRAFVKLQIYDVLGNEVATLVNNELNAGVYKTNWNAWNYPSGVYFCRLNAGDFSETKKMVLTK